MLREFVSEIEMLPIDSIGFQFMWFIDSIAAKEHNELYGDRYPVTQSCFGESMVPSTIKIDVLADEMSYRQTP